MPDPWSHLLMLGPCSMSIRMKGKGPAKVGKMYFPTGDGYMRVHFSKVKRLPRIAKRHIIPQEEYER